jgi:Pyridine nucleotide-disulphide oxidoreductase
MKGNSNDCEITILGAGPYGLSAAAYLRAAGKEVRVFGESMSFWQNQMPQGMCLRSHWTASSISDPKRELTLDAYCRENGNHCPKPVPLSRFVAYGLWFQQRNVPDLDSRSIRSVEPSERGFTITLSDAQTFTSKRIVVAAGIKSFAIRPDVFDRISPSLASHSSDQKNLDQFSGQSVVVIGGGQSALESAALLKEAGAQVEVISRRESLRWVGLHPRLHHLGFASRMLYSKLDVGPAGISRLVAAPHLFRKLPRWFRDKTAYRAIRPAVAGWLMPRVADVPVTFGRTVVAADVVGNRLRLKLDDGSDRNVDHALLATGYRVDVKRYDFLSPILINNLQTFNGYPVLKRGFETSIAGLHIIGKPAAWSFGPILGFVSGTEFAAHELTGVISRQTSKGRNGVRSA